MCVKFGDVGRNLQYHPDVIQRLRRENRLEILDQEESEELEEEEYNDENYVNINLRDKIIDSCFSN